MPEQHSRAAIILEFARRRYPELIFTIVATDNKCLDIVSNAFDTKETIELLTEAVDNLKNNGTKKTHVPKIL